MDPVSKARASDSRERSLANLKKFKPGQSGNPGGRKKKIFTAICDQVIKRNKKEIEQIMMKIIRKEQMAAVLLLREISDHHEGPVTQALEISGQLSTLSDEQLAEKYEKLTAK
jgi:uncharacterized protein DUF5681